MMKLDVANTPAWILAFMVVSNTMWVATYVLGIRRGFLEKTYAIPMTALAVNFSWEFTFSFIQPHPAPIIYTTTAWVLLDGVIVYQFLKFGGSDFVPNMSPKWRLPLFLVAVATSVPIILTVTRRFEDEGWHIAFAQNLLTSILFIHMLQRRNSVDGQSLYIAVTKMLGTVMIAIPFFLLFGEQPIVMAMLPLTVFCDLLYIVLVYKKSRELGLNPWLRA